jgi:3-dehydroquinate synthetase
LDPRLLAPVVRRNVWLKASVVAADEREQGKRIILNYGHTVGHAVESVAGYALAHGEAVAVGMVAAANIAVAIDWLAPEDAARQEALLRAYGLATSVSASSGVRPAQVLETMGRDKKATGRALRWVLPTRIGSVGVARNLPHDLVRRTLEALLE